MSGPMTSCGPLVSEANCAVTFCARACRSAILLSIIRMGTRIAAATAPMTSARASMGMPHGVLSS